MRIPLSLGLALGPALVAHPALAQPIDLDYGDIAPLVALFPQAKQMPQGSGLTAGVRISFQSAAAAIGGGASGAGVIQYDIVESDGSRVLAFQHSYADGGAGIYPIASAYTAGLPGIGAFWIHPSVLQGAEAVANTNLSVTRYMKQVAGQNMSVVRFQSTNAGTTVWEFDTATGLLVFDSISAGSSAGQTTLVGIRKLTLPWPDGRAPNWVRPNAEVQYAGSYSITVPAAGTMRNPAQTTIKIARAGAHWSYNQISSVISGMLQATSFGITGPAQLISAQWLPDSALKASIPAQATMIDADPVTNARTFWVRSQDGEIDIQLETSGSRITWVYNPTLGVLDRVVFEVQLATASQVTDISRVQGGSDLNALAQMAPVPEDRAAQPNPPGQPGNPGQPGQPGQPNQGGGGGNGGGGGGCSAVPSSTPLALLLLFGFVAVLRLRRREAPVLHQ